VDKYKEYTDILEIKETVSDGDSHNSEENRLQRRLKTLLLASVLFRMPLQRQATQIVIEGTGRDVTECDVSMARPVNRVGISHGKPCHGRATLVRVCSRIPVL
jgi:hypothetical protein